MKKKNLLVATMLVLSFSTPSFFEKVQDPQILAQKCIGGTGDECVLYTIKLADGNYLSCGFTGSRDGDFKLNRGGFDAFLMKTNKTGDTIWIKTYGGSSDDVFYNIIETANGEIIALGTTSSNDKQIDGHHRRPGTDDIWLVKTNSKGDLIKQHCYGGSRSESTVDLGMSEGLTIDHNGNILFVGETNSTDGDIKTNNHGDYDAWVVKVDSITFDPINSNTIGDAYYDAAYNIYEINGSLFITGSKSTIAATDAKPDSVEAHGKAFAAKLNPVTLDTIWYRVYGGSASEYCNASVPSKDGNLVLSGHASSSNGDCVGNVGFNTWTWKINVSNGNIIWKNFTGHPGYATDTTAAFNLIATRDGGFVAIGAVAKTLDPYFPDAYAVKIDSNGKTQWTKSFGGSDFDQALGGIEEEDSSILICGWTCSIDGDVFGYHSGTASVSQKYFHFLCGKGTSMRKGPTHDTWLVELSAK